ncbi:MAG: hypothetical protein ACK56I_21215, partial [bacterium]
PGKRPGGQNPAQIRRVRLLLHVFKVLAKHPRHPAQLIFHPRRRRLGRTFGSQPQFTSRSPRMQAQRYHLSLLQRLGKQPAPRRQRGGLAPGPAHSAHPHRSIRQRQR